MRAPIVPIVAVFLLLAGCTALSPEQSPSPSPSPELSTSPTATAKAAELTCEGLLGPDLMATATQGFAGQDYLDKIRAEGSSLALFEDFGGVLCAQSAGNEIGAFYAYSPIAADAQAAEEARLISEGYGATPQDGGMLYSDSASQRMPPPEPYFFREGNWWMASSPESLTAIIANWPGQ